MSEKISKINRKSGNRIGDILALMTDDTKYLTPIFGTIACDVEMPKKNK